MVMRFTSSTSILFFAAVISSTFVERFHHPLPFQGFKSEFGDLWTIYKDDEGKFIVPFYVATGLKQARIAAGSLSLAIDEISQRTCVRFVARTVGLHSDYLYFNTGRKCITSVGRKCGKQQVTIGGRCTSSPNLIAKTLMMTLGVRGEQRFLKAGKDFYEISTVFEDNQVQRRSKPNLFLLANQDIEAIRRAYQCPVEIVASRSGKRFSNPECGRPAILPSLISLHRIFGGKRALIGSYPWQVSIHVKESNEHFCGGALINRLWLLSAAHCFLSSTDPHYYIGYVGKYELKDLTDGIKVEFHLIVYHQNYSVTSKENDIGMVKLKQPVSFTPRILPICLPTGRKIKPGDELIVTGWGATKVNERSEKLRQVNVPLIDFNKCKKWYPQLKKGMLCAGYAAGGMDACFGDSGGALVSWERQGPFEVVGIVSWGKECGKPEKPGVYTNVTHYLDWIYDSMERHR